MLTIETLAAVSSFLAVSALVWLISRWWSTQSRATSARLKELAETDGPGQALKRAPSPIRDRLRRWLPKFAEGLVRGGDEQQSWLPRQLTAAGYESPTAVPIFWTATAAASIVGISAAGALAAWRSFEGTGLALTLASGTLCAALVPAWWVDVQRQRRQRTIERSLPDYLDLLVTCVESGLSLEAGLQRVTSQLRIAHPLLASEMARVQRETEFGNSPSEALQNFYERSGVESIATVATLIQQARRFGSGIAESLRSHSDTLRFEREQRVETLAQQAAVKILVPTMLFIFPALFVVLAGPAAVQLREQFADTGRNSVLRQSEQ